MSIQFRCRRWRGENVSTNEVEAVLSNVLQQQDTIVYGVEVRFTLTYAAEAKSYECRDTFLLTYAA